MAFPPRPHVLPLALAVAALALLAEAFARRLYGARAGLYAGTITLSSFGIFIFSRINIPDVLVCVLLTGALYCFWLTEQRERQAPPARALCWGFAAACALDVLTKGLIGIVFPLAIAGLSLLVTRGLRGAWTRLAQLRPWSSLAVFLVIAVPWHVFAGLANPSQGAPGGVVFAGGHFSVPLPTDGNVHGWTWFYFVNEQVLRYLNLRVPRDYDTVPLWLFLGLILVWLMPWSAFLPAALGRASAAHRGGLAEASSHAEPWSRRAQPPAADPLGCAAAALFYLLHPAGILRAACASADGSADGRLPGRG